MADEEKRDEEQARKEPDKKSQLPETVIIRAYPKIIFLYPTMIAAFLFSIFIYWWGGDTPEGLAVERKLAMAFLIISGLNLLILAFEFTRIWTVALIGFVCAIVFAASAFPRLGEFFRHIADAFASFGLSANWQFFLMMGLMYLIIFLCVFINTRFNYWELTHNEIRHRHGYLGDIERFPAPSLKWTREINDVFEFVLCGAGTLVLSPASEKKDIVLENVVMVNRIDKRIQKLLGTLAVSISNTR